MSGMSTRQAYIEDLAKLQRRVFEMGMAAAKAVSLSMKSLLEADKKLAEEVMKNDDILDDMIVDIEDRCILLIAKQQPIAHDLRVIATGFKISTDLERIGDHAFDIAKIAKRLGEGGNGHIKPLLDIPRMAGLATQMLRDALTAYVNMDVELADKVCQADDEVDALYNQLFRELLTYMLADPAVINDATQLIFVARYLERVADHTTNIAEWVIYLQTGQRLHKN